MTNLKVGDKVTLNPESKWGRCTNAMNPLNIEGEVIRVDSPSWSDLHTVVAWANGNENQYNEKDLIKMEAEVKFAIDDVVVIAPDSQYYKYGHPSNPEHVKGVVVELHGSYALQVKWDNGITNSYEFKDLLKVDVEVEIGDTVMVIGGGPIDTSEHVLSDGAICKVVGKGMRPDGSSVQVIDESRDLRQFVAKEHLVVVEKGTTVPVEAPAPLLLKGEAVEVVVETPKAPKLSYKKYKDQHDDFFKVDTSYSKETVSFEPCEDEDEGKSPDVILNVAQVKRLRKQLKNWLDANGHND